MPLLMLRFRRFHSDRAMLHPLGAALLAALISLSLWAGTTTGDGIDYEDYIHWVSVLDMVVARDLAVAGDYAYVADGPAGLRVVDITDPSSSSSRPSRVPFGDCDARQVEAGDQYDWYLRDGFDLH